MTQENVENGVHVAALLEARDALRRSPQMARFTWRSLCEWVNGMHCKSTIRGFFGLGREHRHFQPFTVSTDHPACFAADDNAPTPVEIVLSGLAACLTGGIAAVAQHRGIQLRSVTAEVEGDMDVRGILGMDADIRNGFDGIRVVFKIEADASREDIEALVAQSRKRSAVFDVITNPGNIKVSLA